MLKLFFFFIKRNSPTLAPPLKHASYYMEIPQERIYLFKFAALLSIEDLSSIGPSLPSLNLYQ